jgi:O-acetyl-ADP-ribose deacetylase (regulator of RNase III)
MDGLEVVARDITEQRIDSVVNAANNSLLGGGGVDGAIHRAAGPELPQECRLLAGCATGNARITSGYNLPARWVLHTVGPVWKEGGHRERDLLASCYRRCLELAEERSIRTIAFPAISTGAYGFPVQQATSIAVSEVAKYLEANPRIKRVSFVCSDKYTARTYGSAWAQLDRTNREALGA